MKKPIPILLLFFSLVSAQDFRQTVAVIDFDASGISQLEATYFTNRFRTALGDVGVMRLVERGMMEEVLPEKRFQQTGCTSEECAVEVGQFSQPLSQSQLGKHLVMVLIKDKKYCIPKLF